MGRMISRHPNEHLVQPAGKTLLLFAAGKLLLLAGCGQPQVQPEEVRSALQGIRTQVEGERFDEAIGATRTLLDRVGNAGDLGTATVVELVDLLLTSCSESHQCLKEDVRAAAERLIRAKGQAPGPEHVDLLANWTWLGQLALQAGAFEASRSHYEQAIRLGEENLGASHPEIGDALRGLANALIELADFDEALDLFERELIIVRQEYGADHLNVARNLYGQARCNVQMGAYERAEELFEEALKIAQDALGPDHPRLAWILNGLANAHDLTGSYVEAKDLYERALQISETHLGPNDPFVSDCLNNLGLVLRNLGDYPAARKAFERALEITEKTLGQDHPGIAANLTNLAETLDVIGEHTAAETLYGRALSVRERAYGHESSAVAETLHAIGFLRLRRGDREADQPFQRAVAIWEKLPRHPDFVEALRGLALVRQRQGKLSEARELLERGLEMSETGLGGQHPWTSEVLGELAQVLARSGESSSAFEMAVRSEGVARDRLRLTARFLPEQMSLRFAKTQASGLDLALSLAAVSEDPEIKRRALDTLIRSRAVVLDEMARRHRTLSDASDPETVRLAADLLAASRRMANLVVRGPKSDTPQTYEQLLSQARREKATIERRLAERTGRYWESEADIGLEEVASKLPPRTGLITFALYHELADAAVANPSGTGTPHYVAFVLRHQSGSPVMVPLGDAGTIDHLIAQWRSGVRRTHQPQRLEATGTALRERVWDPVASFLDDQDSVLVVPDHMLHFVSFAALPDRDGRFLLETGPVFVRLSTERDLVPTHRSGNQGKGLFVLGGVAFEERAADHRSGTLALESQARAGTSRRSVCAGFRLMRFEPLPGSASEAEEISRLWKQRSERVTDRNEAVVHLSGSAASERAFKRQASGKRIVHLATHGFFLDGDCSSPVSWSRGVGGLSSPEPGRFEAALDENPLLYSGLAFAGANQRESVGPEEEDGILTAQELASVDLSGVELAVLSACDTGAGKIESGEGVLGLGRALHIAGVRTTIMSLWPADDLAAREVMTAFYERYLFRGDPVASALRDATLAVLKRRRDEHRNAHPFFWAGWVVVGSPPVGS